MVQSAIGSGNSRGGDLMGINQIASELALKVRTDFVKKNSDLLAILDKTPEQVLSVVMAAAELDKTARESVVFYMEGLDQSDVYARKIAREDFYNELYRITAKFFCDAMSDGIFKVVMVPTPEADAELTELSYIIGNMKRPAPAPKPLSAAQLLEKEVIEDFAGKSAISVDRMKKKMNRADYAAMYRQLAETDKLKSQATTLHDVVGG